MYSSREINLPAKESRPRGSTSWQGQRTQASPFPLSRLLIDPNNILRFPLIYDNQSKGIFVAQTFGGYKYTFCLRLAEVLHVCSS